MNTFEGYAQADYSSENWMILLNAKAEGDTNIDNATSVEDVMSALANAQAAMAAVKTLLDYAKEAAHFSLNAALAGYAQDDYSPENWTILLNLTDYTDNTASVADVMTALNNAKAAMAKVNTLLTDAKIAAHTSLNTALAVYSQADYSPDNWTVLNGLKEAGDTAIDAAKDLAEVEAAQSAAVTGMEGVKTIARTLAAAKSAALEALSEVFENYTESDYTADDWTVLNGFKEAGDTAIDAAADLVEVEAAQSAAVTGMEGVQAFAWILAAAKSAALESLTEVFENYTESDYVVDDWTVLNRFKEAGDTAIDAAADLVEVEAAQSAAVTGMEGVQTIARTLAAAKSSTLYALAAVFGTYTEGDYTADDWTVLNGFKEAGDTAIDAASDLAEVEAAQSTAVTGMEGVKTIAQTLAAAKSAAHETLAAAFEADTESSDTVDADKKGDDSVDADTESSDTVCADTECNDTVDADTESNDIVDDDTESDNTIGDDTESSDTVCAVTESNDTVDGGTEMTDLIVTGDTEADAVTESEQIEEPPAADATDLAAETEVVDSDIANDAAAASQEISETNNDTPNAAEEKSADIDPALESITLDTTKKRHG
jgi:hypothetical protein